MFMSSVGGKGPRAGDRSSPCSCWLSATCSREISSSYSRFSTGRDCLSCQKERMLLFFISKSRSHAYTYIWRGMKLWNSNCMSLTVKPVLGNSMWRCGRCMAKPMMLFDDARACLFFPRGTFTSWHQIYRVLSCGSV